MNVRPLASGRTRAGYWWVLFVCLLLAGGASASVQTAAAQGTNADPVAKDNAFMVKMDGVRRMAAPGVLNNDRDPDGDALSAKLASSPAHGALVLRRDGSLVYRPDAGYRGRDSFTYRAVDGAGGADSARVEIFVWKDERPPIARNDVYGTREDETLTVAAPGLLRNDTGVFGRPLSTTKVSEPRHGNLSLARDGSFVYSPDGDYNGRDSFAYRVADRTGAGDRATVELSVGAVNDAPAFTGAAANSSQTIDERAGLAALKATDADGDALTFESTGGSLPPGITLRDDGGFDGVAGGRAAGSYTANIRVSDGNGGRATTELAITVNAVEEAAVAADAAVTTEEDTAKTITLTATDADSDSLTFATSTPGHGSLGPVSTPDCSTSAGGATSCSATVDYAPDPDFEGQDSFTFTAGDSAPATVRVAVNPANDAPRVALADPPTGADEGDTKTFAFTVADPDAGDTFTVKGAFPDCGTGGVPVGQATTTAGGGSFQCRFPDGPAGPDVRVQVADSRSADSNVASRAVAVANVKPTISLSGPARAEEGAEKEYAFSVTDPGDDTHAVTTACGSNGQRVQGSEQYDQPSKSGSLRCLFPDGPATTSVTATATDSDGAVDTDNQRVEVVVDNVAPTAPGLTGTTFEDIAQTYTLPATDPANDPLTFSIAGLPADGTLYEGPGTGGTEITAPGPISGDRVTYEPDADFYGSDSFTYRASDGDADSDTATVAISVDAVNDAPVNTVPRGPLSTDGSLNITGLSVSDVDAGDNDIQTTLGVDGGTLTLDTGVQNGATVLNNGSNSVTLSGTVQQINATLGAGVVYNNTTGGSFTLTVTTNDGGHAGSGGPKADADTVTISVDAAPAVTTTTPAGGATDVALNGNITVDFGEPVNATVTSFELKCPATDGARGFALSNAVDKRTYTLDPDNDLPGATECRVRVIASQVSDADTNDPPDNMAADHTFSFTTAPRAVDDDFSGDFTVTGNVRFDSADASPSFGVLDNDEVGASNAAVTSAGWQGNAGKTENGGDITVRSNGTFEYDPPAGYEGLDRFTYASGGGPTATVTLKVGGMVWFVDENAASGGDGRLSSPFDLLSAFNGVNNGTGNNPAPGDNVFLYESDENYAGGVTLLNNQKLVGQDAVQSLADIANLTPPSGSAPLPATDGLTPDVTRATITNSGSHPDAHGIVLAQNNTIRGLTVGNTSASGIKATNVNNASMGSDVAVSGDNGDASVDISGGNGTIDYAGTISSTIGRPVSVTNRTGGTVTFGGNISSTAGGINVQNNSGTTTFQSSEKRLNTGSNAAVTLGNAGTVNFMNGGLVINTTSGAGFTASGASTVNVIGSGNTINSTNNTALNLSNASSGPNGITFDSVTSNGGANNVNISGHSFGNVTMNGGALGGASERALSLSGNGSNITYAGTISNSNQGIRVANVAGTTTFSGATKTLNTGTNPAVTLDNNDNGTVRFTNGGLDIDTTSGTGFNAVNGATAIEVSGPNNTISSGTGTALNVQNTNIGPNGLTFRSLSAGPATGSGPANGILLSNTGNQGGLTVTGNGGACTMADPACTGGTIQNTTGDGVSLTSTSNPSIGHLQVRDTAGHGISGTTTSGLSLSNSLVRGAGDADNEAGLFFASVNGTNLTGASSITNTVVHAPADIGALIQNYGGTLNLTVSGSTFSGTQSGTPGVVTGDDLVRLNAIRTASGSPTITASFTGSLFDDSAANGITALAQSDTASGGGMMNLTADGNTFDGNGACGTGATPNCNDSAIAARATQAGTLRFTIQNNNVQNQREAAIAVDARETSSAQGAIQNNTIGTAGVPRSGSYAAQGIRVAPDGSADIVARIHNNTVRSTYLQGIWAEANDGGGGTPKMDVILTSNTTPTPSQSQGTYLPSLDVQGADNANVCAKVEGNSAHPGRQGANVGSLNGPGSIDLLQAHSATFKIEGLPTPTNDASDYVKIKNPDSAAPVNAFATTTFTGGTCRTPAP